MKQNIRKVCLTALFLLFLPGCFFRAASDLYTVPRPAEEYEQLQAKIDEVRGGAEYAAPLQGTSTQTVQLVDLLGNGTTEAITFFRVSGTEKPLKIYIFRKDASDDYEVAHIIEGEGTAIRSVAYLDLGGGPEKEIVVSWQLSSMVHTLVAYSLDGEEPRELMLTKYTSYKAIDIDRDGESELLVIHMDAAGGNGRVELYDYQDATMALHSSTMVSGGATEISSAYSGFLQGNVPALFLTLKCQDGSLVTDIFTMRNGALANITLNPATGRSDDTERTYAAAVPTDINGDSILEIPQPVAVRTPNSQGTADNFYLIKWRQYDVSGAAFCIGTTYHSYNTYDRWYLVLPDEWEGRFTLSRSDNTNSGERAVVFSWWQGGDNETPIPFLVIYKLTGTNRELRSKMGSRFILRTESDAIYAAEFKSGGIDCGLDKESLKERFDLIRIEWSSGS